MELLVFENYTLQKERLVKFIFKINVIAEKIQNLFNYTKHTENKEFTDFLH